MSDLIDVLSHSGLRTGEVLSRVDIHRLGKYHRAVHLYILNSKKEILLQKRSLTVDHLPGAFGISVTGHVLAGESSSACIKREVEEELGIPSAQLQIHFLFSFFQEAVLHETYIDRQFNDVYISYADIRLEDISFDRSEVAEVTFVPFTHFQAMALDGESEFARIYGNECRDLVYFLSANRPSL